MSATLTPTQRAEKMVQTMLMGTGDGKSYFDYFLSQLEAVAQEARDATWDEAREFHKAEQDHAEDKAFASGFKDGFSAGAREMREYDPCDLETEILALPLPSALPTLTDSPSTAKGEKV